MNFFLKHFKLISRIKFCCPEKGDIVVFDYEGSDVIKKLIFYDKKLTILPVRGEIFYLCPRILILFLKNFIWIYLFYRKYRDVNLTYLLSCIEYIKPQVLITFIDNNSLFHAISEIYNEAVFYAIQNGSRNKYSIAKPICSRASGDVYSKVNFFCFGEYEIDLYKSNEFMVKRFYPVGSLIGGYYRSRYKPSLRKYDLCLVSQWRRVLMLTEEYPAVKGAIITLDNYVRKFAENKGLSICIARCSLDPAEEDYFKKRYGKQAHIINFDWNAFSTYIAMDSSEVVLTLTSTAACESLGWGKKVLFCNFSGDQRYNFPINGVCSINDTDYEIFKNKLDWLINLENEEYLRLTRAAARYLMCYDFSMPAHKYIRKMVMEYLNRD